MKKYIMPCLLTLLLGLVIGLVYNFFTFGGIGLLPSHITLAPTVIPNKIPPLVEQTDASSRANLLEQSNLVLAALESSDFQALSELIHPQRGITFTTFSTVDPLSDLTFTPEQLSNAGSSTAKYLWGYGHGSGMPIELTVSDYFSNYLYSVDYINAPLIGVNHVSSSGNSLENVAEAYPDDLFLEYYFPGQDPEQVGLDWSALKTVFGEYQGTLKLVALIHSEWTI